MPNLGKMLISITKFAQHFIDLLIDLNPHALTKIRENLTGIRSYNTFPQSPGLILETKTGI